METRQEWGIIADDASFAWFPTDAIAFFVEVG